MKYQAIIRCTHCGDIVYIIPSSRMDTIAGTIEAVFEYYTGQYPLSYCSHWCPPSPTPWVVSISSLDGHKIEDSEIKRISDRIKSPVRLIFKEGVA